MKGETSTNTLEWLRFLVIEKFYLFRKSVRVADITWSNFCMVLVILVH